VLDADGEEQFSGEGRHDGFDELVAIDDEVLFKLNVENFVFEKAVLV
jgi:hypothetical protein